MADQKNQPRPNQEQIVAQSQLKLAFDYLNSKDTEFTSKELLGLTNLFIDYVVNGYTKELGERCDKFDNYLKTKVL